MKNKLEQAIQTNDYSLKKLALFASTPHFKKESIEKERGLLEKEISGLRHKAFGTYHIGCMCSGVDINILNAKLLRLDCLNENLRILALKD